MGFLLGIESIVGDKEASAAIEAGDCERGGVSIFGVSGVYAFQRDS